MIHRTEKFHEFEIVTWESEASENFGFGYNIMEDSNGKKVCVEKNWDFACEESAMEAAKDLIASGGLK